MGGGAYIRNDLSVSEYGWLIHGGLYLGEGVTVFSEVYGILQANE